VSDIDEQSVQITVSAGPSNLNIFTSDSGYRVNLGAMLFLRAAGTVVGDVNLNLESGPDGLASKPDFPLVLDSAPHLALIARIDSGPWFLVGASRLVEASVAGEIFFAVNEVIGSFQNNSGAFAVTLGKGIGSNPDNPDTDGDGFPDGVDGAPLDPTEHLDTDGDGIGNNLDPDDDNDGLFDSEETGAMFTVAFNGTPDPVPALATGLHLVAGEFPTLSATGTLVDGANLESSTPEGRADLNTDGLVLAKIGSPIYGLLGRIGHGEWFSIGASGEAGYESAQNLSTAPRHLGDNTVAAWEVPVPEGASASFSFNLDRAPQSDALLHVEVWSSREDNRVSLNGLFFGRLCANRTNSFVACDLPIPVSVLSAGSNTLRITAGPDDDSADTTSTLDDFQFRNLSIEFTPTDYRIIETTPHHIGNETVPSFEFPDPESTSLGFNFTLTHLPASGTAQILVDDFDVSTGRPENPVFLNGNQIGTLCQRDSALSSFWQQCTIDFDVSDLMIGSNRIEIKSATRPSDSDFDDFMVRFLQVRIPFTGPRDELYLSFNERIGEYTDDTGSYKVTIGHGILTDPLNPDSDGDGITDGAEEASQTDPNNPLDPPPSDLTQDGIINFRDIFAFSRIWFGPANSWQTQLKGGIAVERLIDSRDLVRVLEGWR
jgi:hypothetical protein